MNNQQIEINNGRYPQRVPTIVMQILLLAFVAGITWMLRTYLQDGLIDSRVMVLEQKMPEKANKEAMEAFQREVLQRLERIERKIDTDNNIRGRR